MLTIYLNKIRRKARRKSLLNMVYITGLRAEFKYPSQKAIANPHGATVQLHRGSKMYRKKNGSQHRMKEPMISPRINVALFSFFRAILRFSRSGSRISYQTTPYIDYIFILSLEHTFEQIDHMNEW